MRCKHGFERDVVKCEICDARVLRPLSGEHHGGKPIAQKECTTCPGMKDASEFYQDARASDGLKGQCKRCHKAGTVRARRA